MDGALADMVDCRGGFLKLEDIYFQFLDLTNFLETFFQCMAGGLKNIDKVFRFLCVRVASQIAAVCLATSAKF